LVGIPYAAERGNDSIAKLLLELRIALQNTIIATSDEAESLDLLRKYVLYNCCRSGCAPHRDRIEDIDLLIPLVQRWQDEIWRHAADQPNHTTSVPAFRKSGLIQDTYTTAATSTPSHTTTPDTTSTSLSYYQPNARMLKSNSTAPSKQAVRSSPYRHSSLISSTTTYTEFRLKPFESKPCYTLRPREANTSTSISHAPLSEFRPTKQTPFPDLSPGKSSVTLKNETSKSATFIF
jgi:hypothetical protein